MYSCIYCLKVKTRGDFTVVSYELTTGTSAPPFRTVKPSLALWLLWTLWKRRTMCSWRLMLCFFYPGNTLPSLSVQAAHWNFIVFMFLMTFTNLLFSLPQLFWTLTWGGREHFYGSLCTNTWCSDKSSFNARLFIWMCPLWALWLSDRLAADLAKHTSSSTQLR